MKGRPIVAAALLLVVWGCEDKKPTEPSTRIVASPASLTFDNIGLTSQVRMSFFGSSTPPPDSFWHVSSTNPGVAAVTPQGPLATVTATGTGTAFIHIELETVSDTADIPVTVTTPAVTAYNGTYKGEAKLVPALSLPLSSPPHVAASCAGSLSSYAETAAINVGASGAGTFTLTDTPGFDRAYQVTIPGNLTFSATGTFSFLGAPVPGQVSVTIDDATHLTFQETTNWGSCSNTYGGQLTKQ